VKGLWFSEMVMFSSTWYVFQSKWLCIMDSCNSERVNISEMIILTGEVGYMRVNKTITYEHVGKE